MRKRQTGLHFLRAYIGLGLFFYYRRITVKNRENIPEKGPVLLLANHQNALLDALLLATKSGQFCYYLTRASVFKKPVIAKFLRGLNMLPVYRVRDGWNSISNNNEIFDSCTDILSLNKTIVIFPEGSHAWVRKVRPLSKGFTRIVFDFKAKYPELDLQLVPVGINYEDALDYGNEVLLNVGTPVSASGFTKTDSKNEVKLLRETVQHKLQRLTTHIADDTYHEKEKELETLEANFLEPETVNHYLEHKEQLKGFIRQKSALKELKQFFNILVKLAVFPAYLLWTKVFRPKIKEIEFISTFRFALAITLVPVWLLIVGLVLGSVLGWTAGVSWLLTVLLLQLLAVKL
ncbi:1-acyl-sn-glycerol-3-phosphate acyltransferase [Formosa sp. S-31]|uniref:1-acyl-sn-glycerol-3-phosphate acyltransferase n=1 Tax=Formosa sp. S-31 TaxID=2790949 RepID=UPI003EB880CD